MKETFYKEILDEEGKPIKGVRSLFDIWDQADHDQQLTLRDRAEKWVGDNPEVFALFEKFALQIAQRKRKFGMKLIAERVRYEVMMSWDKDSEGFKVNNSYVSHIARILAEKHPHLAEWIEFRATAEERREAA